MKLKNGYDITDKIFKVKFYESLDTDSNPDDDYVLLFVKDMTYTPDCDIYNKLTLIIILHNGYVVNNNITFNNLTIEDNKYIFNSIHNPNKANKMSQMIYYTR